MLDISRSADRGHFDHGWLDTFHSFSFADYYDPARMGFRDLRVINEDRVAPGQGFPTHGHRDMEIITYVVSGVLEHKDSMGSISQIKPGDVQHMTAGSGILHSEYNPSSSEPVHLLQIWIKPRELRLAPAYQERTFSVEQRTGRLCLLAAPAGAGAVLPIEQDVLLYASLLAPGQEVAHALQPGRHAWVQVVRGEVDAAANDGSATRIRLLAGDGAAVSEATGISLVARTDAELLVFDLA
jgi:quercetin 2,3-dioxygenase